MDVIAKETLLRSWKEIAAYLGYDERTCYRWEKKFGMPVHRADEGTSKSRVFAYKDELDAWFQETFKNSHGEAPPAGRRPRRLRWLLAAILPIAAAAAVLIIQVARGPLRQPVDFHIRGSTLVILDVDGREIWRKDTRIDGLEDESYYRTYFQVVDSEKSGLRLPSLVIKDVDGDGLNEILFAVQKRSNSYDEGRLYCWDAHGTERWHFDAGREMRFGAKDYSADYRIHGFIVHDFNQDGRQEIIIVSYQYPQWPCQLAVLDGKGRMTGEYWNSGQLKDVKFQDLDGDGREEMLVAGINNQYGGCLIVFDHSFVRGGSPQTGAFKAADLPSGSELAYILLPRTDVSLALGEIVEGLAQLGVTSSRRLRVVDIHGLIFEFGFDLRCLDVDWGHGFMMIHNDLLASGKIHSDDDEAYRKILKDGIRYWNGSAWLAEPTEDILNAAKRPPAINNRR
jgi:hypothetical protein